jgi:hypothetical protein
MTEPSTPGTSQSTRLSYAVWCIRPAPLHERSCDLPGDAVRQYVFSVEGLVCGGVK